MNNRATRLLLATVALTALAALLAGGANARAQDETSETPAQTYPSHVIGAGASQWDGRAMPSTVTVGGELTPVPRRRVVDSPQGYPGFVIGAGGSQRDGRTLPSPAEAGGSQATPAIATSSGDDADWTAFAAGAGTVALLAAALAGVVLTTRRRHSVGMP